MKHLDVVTCLSLDASGSILMSGSKDSTSMLWSVKKQGGISIGITNTTPLHVLTGMEYNFVGTRGGEVLGWSVGPAGFYPVIRGALVVVGIGL